MKQKINNMDFIYEQAFVIGIGTVATNCAKILSEKGITTFFIESRKDVPMSSKSFCEKHNIKYIQASGKELTSFLDSVTNRTLIVSASNRYLFPKHIIEKENFYIINYHGALLPKFPGRNAESWAIYYGEKMGGITWHRVSPVIDAGEILLQKEVGIKETTTSIQLLRQYSRLSVEGFIEFIDSLLTGTIKTHAQNKSERQKMFYSWMKPNDGILNLDWNFNQISQFLRSMDYGPLRVFGYPILKYEGKSYKIISYSFSNKQFCNKETFDRDKMTMYIHKESGNIEILLEE